ncbi:MAG: hypothetical protein ACRDSZ_05645 [Pseudonocardiaceae bacterium]
MSEQSPDSERIFTGQELDDALGTLPRGVLLLHDESRPAGSWDLGDRWDWGSCLVPVEVEPLVEAGLMAAVRRGTVAVVLHPGGDADPARLALIFALYLDARRRRDPEPVRPCVISRCPPTCRATRWCGYRTSSLIGCVPDRSKTSPSGKS